MKDILKAIIETDENIDGKLYDYIAKNYYQLSKDELKELLLSYIFIVDKDTTIEVLKETLERF